MLFRSLADHCLLFGYANQARRIDRSFVDAAIEYLEQGMPTHRRVLFFVKRLNPRLSQWFVKLSMLHARRGRGGPGPQVL